MITDKASSSSKIPFAQFLKTHNLHYNFSVNILLSLITFVTLTYKQASVYNNKIGKIS